MEFGHDDPAALGVLTASRVSNRRSVGDGLSRMCAKHGTISGMGTAGGERQRALIAHPGAEMYGSDRVLLDAAIGFVDAGWDVRVILPATGALVAALEQHGVEVKIQPTLVLRKALMKPSGWSQLIAGFTSGRAQVMREIREYNPTLVYVSTITQPLWAPVARRLGVPVIVHVHEAEASANAIVRRGLYASVRSADRIATASGFALRTMLDSYPALASRSTVVPNPVPGPPVVVPPRASLDGPLRVGYVGRLSPRKGVDVAVTAVGGLIADGIDARLDLIGAVFEGYEWYDLELRATAARLAIEDRVIFHGFRDSVWDALADIDVLVVPSRFDEPFGNTAVEGVLALRPVIASDTSGLREATDRIPTAMLVTPDSADDLERALADVVLRWPEIVAATPDAARIAGGRHDVNTFRRALLTMADEAIAARR